MINSNILHEECCICLDVLNLNDSFFYFNCQHRIHTICANLLQICPLCRALRRENHNVIGEIGEIDEIIEIAEVIENMENPNNSDTLQTNIIEPYIQRNNVRSEYCKINIYILTRLFLLLALLLFFIVKFIV